MTSLLDTGSNLVVARRAAGVSQRELGARLGVRQQQVARWEATGYRNASLTHVAAAADALGLTTCADIVTQPMAAETPATYATGTSTTVSPVRDLGEVAARIRMHSDVLRDRFTITRVGVFGSFANGEQTAESDVDLLVDMEDPGGFRFIEAADFAEEILGRRVDVVRPHLLKDRLRNRSLKEAVYVWSA